MQRWGPVTAPDRTGVAATSSMKHSGETRPSGKWLLAAIGGSLLLHGSMMLVPYWQQPAAPDAGRTIRLVSSAPISQPEPESLPEQEPLSEQETIVEPPVPEPTSAPAPAEPLAIVAIPALASQQSTDEPVDESSDEPFSQHVLASVRELHGELEIPKEPDILQPHSVPALPAQPGWLNDHVGMVEAGWERWQNADGTRESRIVMANGQVVCGRARAPVPSEIFNPQFALNIMAFRLCGRERPEPVDRTDPWLRGGPK